MTLKNNLSNLSTKIQSLTPEDLQTGSEQLEQDAIELAPVKKREDMYKYI